jgi:hypothetical protein
MELRDITEWASSEEPRTITVSQIFLDARYNVRVRKFIPVEGDMLEEKWHDNAEERKFAIPPYAIVNMEEAADSIRQMVVECQHLYLYSILKPGQQDSGGDFLWDTYFFAFRYADQIKVRCSSIFIPAPISSTQSLSLVSTKNCNLHVLLRLGYSTKGVDRPDLPPLGSMPPDLLSRSHCGRRDAWAASHGYRPVKPVEEPVSDPSCHGGPAGMYRIQQVLTTFKHQDSYPA